jgi:hypothetical protein
LQKSDLKMSQSTIYLQSTDGMALALQRLWRDGLPSR